MKLMNGINFLTLKLYYRSFISIFKTPKKFISIGIASYFFFKIGNHIWQAGIWFILPYSSAKSYLNQELVRLPALVPAMAALLIFFLTLFLLRSQMPIKLFSKADQEVLFPLPYSSTNILLKRILKSSLQITLVSLLLLFLFKELLCFLYPIFEKTFSLWLYVLQNPAHLYSFIFSSLGSLFFMAFLSIGGKCVAEMMLFKKGFSDSFGAWCLHNLICLGTPLFLLILSGASAYHLIVGVTFGDLLYTLCGGLIFGILFYILLQMLFELAPYHYEYGTHTSSLKNKTSLWTKEKKNPQSQLLERRLHSFSLKGPQAVLWKEVLLIYRTHKITLLIFGLLTVSLPVFVKYKIGSIGIDPYVFVYAFAAMVLVSYCGKRSGKDLYQKIELQKILPFHIRSMLFYELLARALPGLYLVTLATLTHLFLTPFLQEVTLVFWICYALVPFITAANSLFCSILLPNMFFQTLLVLWLSTLPLPLTQDLYYRITDQFPNLVHSTIANIRLLGTCFGAISLLFILAAYIASCALYLYLQPKEAEG